VNISRKVENISTFTKVYGYVRWFYPSDEAAQLDWNKFAVYGIQKVETARNEKELKKILIELFNPIAPAIQIFETDLDESFDVRSIVPENDSDLIPVSWKHLGVFLGDPDNCYRSVRINRDTVKKLEPCFRYYGIPVSQYHGKKVKITISARSDNTSKGNAYIFISFFQEESETLNDSEPTTIKPDTCWNEYSRTIMIGKDDEEIGFGIGIDRSLSLLVSDFRMMVEVNNIWIPVNLRNGNFAQALDGWYTDKSYYDISLDSIRSEIGNHCVKINYTNSISKTGEYIKKNIGNNLSLIMPLALYSSKEHTYPVPDLNKWNRLKEQLNQLPADMLKTKNRIVRLANIVITWNVFQHFYPYFDVVHTDWEKELTKTLQNIYSLKTEPQYYMALREMTAKLEDAHVSIAGADFVRNGLKIKVDLFGKEIVVTSSGSDLIQKGDIITSIDGRSSLSEIQKQENLISASPNVKRYYAIKSFGNDLSQNDAQVILTRDDKEIHVEVPRIPLNDQFFTQVDTSNSIIDCGDSIFYIKGQIQDINSLLNILANAKGVIIGSVSQLWELLPHMIKEPVWSAHFLIPINIYPDREKTSWQASRWTIEPKLPFIKAKFVIITSPSDVSSYETALGFVDNYKLGKLVGDTTAGCNGNVNYLPLIGRYTIRWSGMKVLKHNGSQHHLIGFIPDYPIVRTKEAVLQGKDEYLDKAREILK
jgi:hypothetical protein